MKNQTLVQDLLGYPVIYRLPMKINCNMFTAQNNSSWKDLSCLTLQMQMGTDIRLTKTKGTKTSTQMCLRDSKLSATNSSNINSNKWVAKLISIALYWMYSSALRWVWGLLHQTIEPMIAPDTEEQVKIFRLKKFSVAFSRLTCNSFPYE